MENKLDYVDVSFKDTALVLTTSVAGSTVGMVGCAFLRRRMLRFRDMDLASIGPTSPGTTICGYFFILTGLAALALPSPVIEEMQPSVDFDVALMINGIISFCVGTLTVALLHFLFYKGEATYWAVLKFLQGGLASFVAISSAYDLYSTPMSVVVGLTGAICFFFISEYVFTTTVEDNCNIISIHFTCGIVSFLLPPFFSCRDNIGFLVNPSAYMNMIHLTWQVLCCIIVIAVVATIFCVVFFLLLILGLLRIRSERIAHERAKRVKKRGGDVVTTETTSAINYILPNIEHKEFNVFKMSDDKPGPSKSKSGEKKSPKSDVYLSRQEVAETPLDSAKSGGGHSKIKRSLEILKGHGGSKSKLQRRLQKCKNIVVKNPEHKDSVL